MHGLTLALAVTTLASGSRSFYEAIRVSRGLAAGHFPTFPRGEVRASPPCRVRTGRCRRLHDAHRRAESRLRGRVRRAHAPRLLAEVQDADTHRTRGDRWCRHPSAV